MSDSNKCGVTWASYKAVEQKLQRTEEALRVAKEALEYYSDKRNWQETNDLDDIRPRIINDSLSAVYHSYIAGHKANKSLKQIKEILGDKDEL